MLRRCPAPLLHQRRALAPHGRRVCRLPRRGRLSARADSLVPRLRDGALASVAGSLASVPAALLTGRLPAGLELTAFSAQQELDADTLAAALFLYHACLPAQRAPGLAAAAVGFAAVRALSQLRASPGCSAVPLDCGGAALDAAMGANLAASFAVALAAAMSAAAAVLLARQGGPP